MSTATDNISLGNGIYATENPDGSYTVSGPGAGEYAGVYEEATADPPGAIIIPGGTVDGFPDDTYWVER